MLCPIKGFARCYVNVWNSPCCIEIATYRTYPSIPIGQIKACSQHVRPSWGMLPKAKCSSRMVRKKHRRQNIQPQNLHDVDWFKDVSKDTALSFKWKLKTIPLLLTTQTVVLSLMFHGALGRRNKGKFTLPANFLCSSEFRDGRIHMTNLRTNDRWLINECWNVAIWPTSTHHLGNRWIWTFHSLSP